MNFTQAISSGFAKYVQFGGRACRSEYWYWVLFNVLAQVVTELIDNAVIGMSVTTAIFSLAVLLPGIAVAARRLHDVDRTGWWLLPQLVALAAIIFGCVQIAKSPLAAETTGLVRESASTVLLSREQAGRPRT